MNENSADTRSASTWVPHAVIYAKGIAMGLGDSVPGISGGTIAVITNVFDKLIFSIRSVDLQALRFLTQARFAALWQHINGNFLFLLGLGILSGLLISANTVLYLLENQFEALMAFFIGLVFASTWLLKDKTNFREWKNLLALGIAAIFTITIGELPRADGNFSPLAIFFSGVVGICAMILPGVSGAFILVLLGVYEYMLTSLVEFNFTVIFVFMSGCVLGLMAFSRILTWLLNNYHELSYGFIIGMLLGSLSILWPWQHAHDFYTDSDGVRHALNTIKVWPTQYAELTNLDPKILLTLFCLLAGGLLVLGLEWMFAQTKANEGAINNLQQPSDGGL